MGKIFGGMDIDCEIDEKKGEMLCRGINKGKVEAAVLAQISPDGGMSIKKQRGDMNKIKVLTQYMADNTTIKTKKSNIDPGEF